MATTRRAEVLMALVPAALAVITLSILLGSNAAPVIETARLALAIDILATLVAAAVAVLGWIRYREVGDQAALWRGSALLVLGTINGSTAALTLLGLDGTFGFAAADPGQLPLWATVVPRGVGAMLLIVAGLAATRPLHPPVAAAWVFSLPAVATLIVFAVAASVRESLPPLVDATGLAVIAANPEARLPVGSAVPLVLVQVAIGLAYLVASALSYRAYQRYGRATDAVLAVGLVMAAFSQVLFAIHPAAYSSLVSAGDILRVAFYLTLMATLAVEVRGDIRALRRANDELARLRDAEVATATAEERARLAREIHDGMSQELWFAKLKQGRLLALPSLEGDARELAQDVSGAIESALADARQAILALRPAEGSSFADVLRRYVDDFSDRFGIPAEAHVDSEEAEHLTPRARAELLRIVHEALANVRKHADATLVRVEAAATDGQLTITITDNGRGFAPDQADRSGYGLKSMEQRAALIGARIQIASRPQDGTSVVVAVPLEPAPAPTVDP